SINYSSYKNNISFLLVKNGSKIVAYINAKEEGKLEEQLFISRFNLSTIDLWLGSWGNGYFSKVQINKFMIYDKALTPTEITKNYNIDKIRFGVE
ncbi:MAG: hypothetical protein RSB72_00970, partial [Bacilli bacterium]